MTVGLLVLGSPAALADVFVADDRTAENVSSFGDVGAWSRRDAAGGHRLVVRVHGVVADAPVAPSVHPFNPDVGKVRVGRRMIVYVRCADRSSRVACDVHRYDVAAGTEAPVPELAGTSSSETAPSILNDKLAFGRLDGRRRGLFVLRDGKVLHLSRLVPRETDTSSSRIVYLTQRGHDVTEVRLMGSTGRRRRLLARATPEFNSVDGPTLASPTLSRFNAFWLERPMPGFTYIRRAGINGHRGLEVLTGSPTFRCDVDSIGASGTVDLFDGPEGIWEPQPPPTFTRDRSPHSSHCRSG